MDTKLEIEKLRKVINDLYGKDYPVETLKQILNATEKKDLSAQE